MVTVSSQETASVCCQQGSRNTGKLFHGLMETCQRHQKRCRYWPRGMSIEGFKHSEWLNGPAWLQTDEEMWPNPCCQVNEAETDQVTSTVATKTELDQLFGWYQYSAFNRIRNFTAYCMRSKTKQKGPLKADEIHQAEQILFQFVHIKSFLNVSKSIAKKSQKHWTMPNCHPKERMMEELEWKVDCSIQTLITRRNAQYC